MIACRRSSSVIACDTSATELAAGALFAGALGLACSDRDKFFAVTGALPVTYRAALPWPGRAAGFRTAITDDERAIRAVSSVYSCDGSKDAASEG